MNIYILKQTTFRADGTIDEVENLEAFRNFNKACAAMDEYARELHDGERIGFRMKGDTYYQIDIEAEKAVAGTMFEGSGEYAVRYTLEVESMIVVQ